MVKVVQSYKVARINTGEKRYSPMVMVRGLMAMSLTYTSWHPSSKIIIS